MGLFSKIVDKIFHRHQQAPKPQAAPASQAAAQPQAAPAAPAPAAPQPVILSDVDVEAVLVEAAEEKGGGGNWRTSIVDLLKLLDLDSSLDARKELADELNVHAGDHGSAEQNIALQKAVMRKLAENGGKVPGSLRD